MKDIITILNDKVVIFNNLDNNGMFITNNCNDIEPIIVIITNGLLVRDVVNTLFFSLLQFKT